MATIKIGNQDIRDDMSDVKLPDDLRQKVLVGGDLSRLTEDERLQYMQAVCQSVGLDPITRPLEYIRLSGRLVLYARKDATDQLRSKRGISIEIASREMVEDTYVVTARAVDASGRRDESIGAVSIGGLKGDARANAIMKAETKAKRRVTLSICGLGMLDETELETIADKTPAGPAGHDQAIPDSPFLSDPKAGLVPMLGRATNVDMVAVAAEWWTKRRSKMPKHVYEYGLDLLKQREAELLPEELTGEHNERSEQSDDDRSSDG